MKGSKRSGAPLTTTEDVAAAVVAEVQQQTTRAAELAGIDGQDRLTDPRLNPAVRAEVDQFRNAQQRAELAAEHQRVLRRHRVADARSAEAERTLEAIALARRASSPARSVLALHQGRRRYVRLALAASVVLSAGSAMGVEAAAHALGAARGTGYIAELGLTGLATAVIAYHSHIHEHGGKLDRDSWQSRALWALIAVPVLVSVAANLVKAGPIGVACSIGAAAFALLSYLIADVSAATMQSRAVEVSADDEDDLRAVAVGRDTFDTSPTQVEDAMAELRESAAAAQQDALEAAEREAEQSRLAEAARQRAEDVVDQARRAVEQAVEQARRGEIAAAQATARADAAEEVRETALVAAERADAGLAQVRTVMDTHAATLRAQAMAAEQRADAERAERVALAAELADLRTELRTERRQVEAVRAELEAARTAARTNGASGVNGSRTATRTGGARTPLVDREDLVAELAEEFGAAMKTGDQYKVPYTELRERSGMGQSWCEKVATDARRAAAAQVLPARTDEDRTDAPSGSSDAARTGGEEGDADPDARTDDARTDTVVTLAYGPDAEPRTGLALVGGER